MTTVQLNDSIELDSLRIENRSYKPYQFVKNMVLEFLQLLFQSRTQGNFKWDASNEITEIMITDKNTFNLDTVEKRPAIIVARGPLVWTNQSGLDKMLSLDRRTGKKTYTDLIQSSVTVNIISRNGLESESIAYDVCWGVQAFRGALRKVGFFKIEGPQMGQETLVVSDSRPDLTMVPVFLTMYLQDKWTMEPVDAARLTKLFMEQLNISI
jgi:hypothetical protein